ncbi:hypothetical protein N431DRAFT_428855 [Stipitochalara longipes BDJ]|nr:hypothetical protein N431DRAFT_428855 [Stipitochalara longipes BDJ]
MQEPQGSCHIRPPPLSLPNCSSKPSATTEALTCNILVNLRSELPPKVVDGAMGTFIDAFKVKLLRSDLYDGRSSSNPTEIWTQARKIQDETRRYFGNTSPSGESYTNIAVFKTIPDLAPILKSQLGQPRPEAFEVSNLGTFSVPTIPKVGFGPTWKAGKVTVSRAALAAGSALVVCVVSSDEGMGFGFTWQEGLLQTRLLRM